MDLACIYSRNAIDIDITSIRKQLVSVLGRSMLWHLPMNGGGETVCLGVASFFSFDKSNAPGGQSLSQLSWR